MNSVSRAADSALDGLRHGEGGLAIYKAAELYGVKVADVCAELAARRKAKREAEKRRILRQK